MHLVTGSAEVICPLRAMSVALISHLYVTGKIASTQPASKPQSKDLWSKKATHCRAPQDPQARVTELVAIQKNMQWTGGTFPVFLEEGKPRLEASRLLADRQSDAEGWRGIPVRRKQELDPSKRKARPYLGEEGAQPGR